MSIAITTFDSKHRADFAQLNYAWITRYFSVEPVDQQVLDNPEIEIIDAGGEIFFAHCEGTVVGTVALKYIDADHFELTKMAVTENQRGKGIGKKLLEKALAHARNKGAKHVVLSSHTSLVPAIGMYRAAGFNERKDHNSCYSRCNIYMQKDL